MKAATLSMSTPRVSGWALLELTKPRLSGLVLFTALAGYVTSYVGMIDFVVLVHLLAGAGLVAGGANAFNQILERDTDARMQRTRNRPLPSGRVSVNDALRFAVIISTVGLAELLLFVNLLTAALGAAALMLYVFVYTPLKRVTIFNTLVGAVVGALPPVMGHAAAVDRLDNGALALFAILFVWQLPHFFSIAWIYRADYARAGFRMISVADASGSLIARQMAVLSTILVPVSLLPVVFGQAGSLYAAMAVALGAAFFACCLWIRPARRDVSARRSFFASVLYLPLLLIVQMMDRL